MGEPGRIQSFLGWWRELPTAWRVNAGLYALAGLSLIALLAQIAIGGGSRPRRVEVAARAPRQPTTTFVAPSTTELTTTTTPPTTAPPATAGPQAPATTRARSGGGGTPSPPAANFQPTPTTTPPCRNSRDPACGPFSWDPPAGGNAPLEISVNGPTSGKVGDTVELSVTVSDPDHVVTGNCTQVSGAQGEGFPCNPPECPPAYGPWTPPPRHGGSRTFRFTATLTGDGNHDVVFTFHTDRDGCQDPYGSSGTERVSIDVAAAE